MLTRNQPVDHIHSTLIPLQQHHPRITLFEILYGPICLQHVYDNHSITGIWHARGNVIIKSWQVCLWQSQYHWYMTCKGRCDHTVMAGLFMKITASLVQYVQGGMWSQLWQICLWPSLHRWYRTSKRVCDHKVMTGLFVTITASLS